MCSSVWGGDVHLLGTAPGILRSESGVASQQRDLQPAAGCLRAVGYCRGGALSQRASLSLFQSVSSWHISSSPLIEVPGTANLNGLGILSCKSWFLS